MTPPIRIGCASGFWGDSMLAAPQLVASGAIDVLVFDYLAEVTMAILARARAKDAQMGYATDFVDPTLRQILPDCAARGIRIIANAGGVNPQACLAAIEKLVAELGLDLKVGVVMGDDLTDRAAEWSAAGVTDMFSGRPFPTRPLSINAYLGAFPVAAALNAGADIVVTGRGVDSAVTLGACIAHHGWGAGDLDAFAGASLAGHIIECGAQATGGLFTDWEMVGDYAHIGYPIVAVEADGSFTVSKPEGTGGLVSRGTVAEQMLYEIGDPARYLLPDVICDFTHVAITETARDRVRVSGARGRGVPTHYKACATFVDGYRLTQMIGVIGIDAARKAQAIAGSVLRRAEAMLTQRGLPPLTDVSVEVIGAESVYGPQSRIQAPREVILKLATRHPSAAVLGAILRETTSSGTSMTPGITGVGGNRPKPMPVVRLFSFLVDKDQVPVRVRVADRDVASPPPALPCPAEHPPGDPPPAPSPPVAESPSEEDCVTVPLVELAWARSGDKGDFSNIGVIARRPEFLPHIARDVTPETVGAWFAHLVKGPVERFFLPGTASFNFLMREALGGGGTASLRFDPQGKGFGQILLDLPVRVPRTLMAE